MTNYKVKDIALADWGRKEIAIAESEMPGLMALRKEYGAAKPLKGARIAGCLHMTIQTAVLIETLTALGAEVTWTSCNIFSTQDHAAAAIAKTGVPVFAWKGETEPEYDECIELQLKAFTGGKGPNMILDDGGDLTHRRPREAPASSSTGPDAIRGLSEETTTGVHRLYEMAKKGTLKVPGHQRERLASPSRSSTTSTAAASRSATASSARPASCSPARSPSSPATATSARAARSRCAASARASSSPRSTRSARSRRRWRATRSRRWRRPPRRRDIFVTATGCANVIRAEHMRAMKDQAILCNIGHFDCEIDVAWLEKNPEIKEENIKPQVDQFIFPDGKRITLLARGRLVNLGCANGHPSFVMSHVASRTRTIAQIELWTEPREVREARSTRCRRSSTRRSRALHLGKLGVKLTKLTKEQAEYLGVSVEGPFKPEHYRY